MNMRFISEIEYESLLNRNLVTKQDLFQLSSYPYVSLLSLYHNIDLNERTEIRKIEDENIFHFFHCVSLLFGIGEEKTIATLRANMNIEPLRSAVMMAKLKKNADEVESTFIELACKMLLSLDKKGTSLDHAMNIKLYGNIPALPFSYRQKKGDEWFNKFVCIKLDGMKKVYKELGRFAAYQFILLSVTNSLYYFSPERFDIKHCMNEEDTAYHIIKVFLEQIDNN